MGTHILLGRRHTYSSTCTAKYTPLQATALTLQAWTKMGQHTNRRAPAYERAYCRPPDSMATIYAERTSPTMARARGTTDEPGVDGG
jgi:hypothetical protein